MTITSRSGIVWLLTGLNLLNYLDRYVITAVSPRIQAELELSDFQTGAIASAFMLGYFVTSPAFGALGDRYARRGLISLGVGLWSVATAASGLARGFVSMIAARISVGVGEASYATLAPTIIDDVTDAASKNRWLAVFYAAIPVGSALGFALGGFVEANWGWRTALFVAGAPGIALALLVLLIREPERKGTESAKPDPIAAARELVAVPLYRGSVLGYTAYTFALGAFAFWAPKYLHDVLGLELESANLWLGLLLAATGFGGTALGGWLGDRAAAGNAHSAPDRARAYLRVCGWVSALAAPIALACLLARTPLGFFVAFALTCLLLFTATAPVNAALLQSAPESRRASAMAVSIFTIHLLGDFPSPPLVGLISDTLRGGSTEAGAAAASLRTAMFTLPAFIAIAGLLWSWYGRGAAAPKPLAEGT